MSKSWVCIAVLLVSGFVTSMCRADDVSTNQTPSETTLAATTPPDTSDKWDFTMPLYVWLAGVNGSLSVNGRSAHLDLSPTDILDHLDVSFMGYFELSKPQYGFYAEPLYMKLSAGGSKGPIKADDDLQMWIAEFGGFYRIWHSDSDRPASLYALAGGRYWNVHNELTLKDPLGKVEAVGTIWMMDPIVGLRFKEYFTKRLHASVQADVGGFGISEHTTRFSWQVLPLLCYDFTMPVIRKPSTVFAGWRQLNVQYIDTTGPTKESFDLTFEGVIFGLSVELF